MEKQHSNIDNLMAFSDEDDDSSVNNSEISWLSVLCQLEQMSNPTPATGRESARSLSPNFCVTDTSEPNINLCDNSTQRQVFNGRPSAPPRTFFGQTPNHKIKNPYNHSNDNTAGRAGLNIDGLHSQQALKHSFSHEDLSPTHSTTKTFGLQGFNDSGKNVQSQQFPVDTCSTASPLSLPAKTKKYEPHFEGISPNSQNQVYQSSLQVYLSTPDNTEHAIVEPSTSLERTDSMSSTGSNHPYDSILLKRNLSKRSIYSRSIEKQSDKSEKSSARNPQGDIIDGVSLVDPSASSLLSDLSLESQRSSEPSFVAVEPLQVKLPDLEKEEKDFFGHQPVSRVKSVPQTTKKNNTHRYSTHGGSVSQSLPNTRVEEDKLKSSKNVFIGESLFEVAKERNAEVVAFGQMLGELRSMFPWHEPSNRGYVLSPILPPSFGEDAFDQDTEIPVVIYTETRRDTIRFVINAHSPVKEVLELTISCLSINPGDVNTEHISASYMYLLKICGRSEYLESGKNLIEYEYIQDCLKFQREVQFVLLESERVSRILARTAVDDYTDSVPRSYKDFFDLSGSTSISKYGLSVLMEAYSDELAKLMQEVTSPISPRFEPSRIIQAAKAICAMLASIETKEIHSAIDALNALQVSQDGEPRVPDPEELRKVLSKLMSSVLLLIEIYCEAFDTDFAASKIDRPGLSGSIDVTSMTDNLRIRVASAHRLPVYWKQDYESFEVDVGVYYGGCILCSTEITSLTQITRKFCDHLQWNEWLQFKILVKQLPRESRLCLTLYGLAPVAKATAVNNQRTPLGWVAMQLFNFNGVLASGTQLLGLWPDAKANPVGACTSNLLDPSSVLMLVEFERYLAEIIFPDCSSLPEQDVVDHGIPQSDYAVYEEILSKDLFNELKPEERNVLWDHRYYCCTIPRALPLVLSSAPSWEFKYLHEIYSLLSVWAPMMPVDALELLKVNFPDHQVRAFAVRWMGNFGDDELCDYLPQLVQALKYEIYHDSPLARFLVRRALGNVRLMHLLFWYLKDKISEPQFGQRFQVILGGLLSICGEAQKEEFTFEDELVMELIKIAQKVKKARDSTRTNILQQELAALAGKLCCVFRLPLTPSLEVVGLDVRSCGYFTSNSAPLRLVFKNVDAFGDNVNVIFKMGDDMRQDTLTMQLVGIMNKIWLREGLDLKIVTYQCMATGPAMGMIEIVSDAQTLREIHTEFGLTGSFKDEPINRWLLKHNPDEKTYRKAVENFTASCAGYCVATYVLGICDRHNDNIMIRKSGNLFHIDFAKILGHAQMFGSFRRDRAPFVLTPDMAYVINGGYRPSSRFQHFVDLCCRAFNLIRRHSNLFLNLLSLMLNSGIASLSNVKDLKYIRDSLLPNASEAEATAAFTRLIDSSLSSWFTQVNFFIHNVAQIRDVSQLKRSTANASNSVLSFALKTYSIDVDGFVESARVVDYQKRYNPEKYYIYVINICRVTQEKPTFVFRRFSHFLELHSKLVEVFPEVILPRLPAKIYLGRSQIRTVAERRRAELDGYLRHLLMLPRDVSECDVLYTFLHSLLHDEEETAKFSVRLLPEERHERPITGEIKLSIRHERDTLRVMVMHAKDLSQHTASSLPDPYVKLYLIPDLIKATKLKTKIAKRTLNPTYNETLVYSNRSAAELKHRHLQVTVWDHDRVGENEFMGGVIINLAVVNLSTSITQWYPLVDLRRS